MKELLQGKYLKDRNIQDFFQRNHGPKRSFDKERANCTKRRKMCAIIEAPKRRSTTSVTSTTVVHAKRYNGQWMDVATTSICTKKEESHEENLMIYTWKHDGNTKNFKSNL
eukprot:6239738-Ditylum_brightwellii.AAC.1